VAWESILRSDVTCLIAQRRFRLRGQLCRQGGRGGTQKELERK